MALSAEALAKKFAAMKTKPPLLMNRARADAAMLEGHERTILAFLMSPVRDACHRLLHRVDERIFANPIHRIIVHAIRDVFDGGERVNIVTVSERLAEMRQLQLCGGRPGISQFAIRNDRLRPSRISA